MNSVVSDRMDFEPINTDHALESMKFTMGLSRMINEQEIAAVRRNHGLWRQQLPAMGHTQAMVVEQDPNTGLSTVSHPTGVEFAHLRSDGNPAWILRVVGQEIMVECNRYTRWDKVWERASSHFGAVIGSLPESASDIVLLNISIAALDKFRALQKEYDLSSLLTRNPHIPDFVFEAGQTWHSHAGWFSHQERDQILNVLNVDARQVLLAAEDATEASTELVIIFSHTQQLRFSEPKALRAFYPLSGEANQAINSLHRQNKDLLGSMLTKTMNERIGLNG